MWRREFPVDFAGEFIRVEGARVNQAFVSPDRHRPYIYIGGSSEQAQQLAIKHADCQLRLIEPLEEFAPKLEPALAGGIEVGVNCNLVVMPTHEEAVDHVYRLAENAGERGKAAVAEWRRMTTESIGFDTMYPDGRGRSTG